MATLFRRILVPHDFSQHATRALEVAADLAVAHTKGGSVDARRDLGGRRSVFRNPPQSRVEAASIPRLRNESLRLVGLLALGSAVSL